MENSTGLTSLESTPLDQSCFSSEQDRLDAYARSLRVPVQAGQNIKGDTGPEGARGPTGPRGAKGDTGAKGDKGDTGDAVTKTEVIVSVGNGVNTAVVAGDYRDNHYNMVYDDAVNPPAPAIGILCIRYDGANTHFYLSDTTVDTKYDIHILSYI
jgi:hypothetical protein